MQEEVGGRKSHLVEFFGLQLERVERVSVLAGVVGSHIFLARRRRGMGRCAVEQTKDEVVF